MARRRSELEHGVSQAGTTHGVGQLEHDVRLECQQCVAGGTDCAQCDDLVFAAPLFARQVESGDGEERGPFDVRWNEEDDGYQRPAADQRADGAEVALRP